MGNNNEKRTGVMKLYNIFYICKSCLPAIKNVKVSEIYNNTNVALINNWSNCKASLDILQNIECFSEKIHELYKLLDWRISLDEPRLPLSDKDKFIKTLSEITYAVEILVNLCNEMEIGKTESGIDVKIPKCNSLKEYMGYLKEIDFMFTQCPYLLHDKEEIKFNNVDVGSQWLVFAITGITASFYILNNLAKLVQKAIAISSNILVYRQQEEALKEMQLKGEILEETVDVFKKFKQTLLENSVADLENDIGELQDGEERDKVKKTLENMVVLMNKGVEIYSSIETPKEIKVLFPMDKDNAILPDNITKLIEDKENGSDTE